MQARRIELLRSACLLTAGDTHLAEDLVQTVLARLYLAWPRVRHSGTGPVAYAVRIVVHAHIDEVRRPRWKRERYVAELPDEPLPERHGSFDGMVDGLAADATEGTVERSRQ